MANPIEFFRKIWLQDERVDSPKKEEIFVPAIEVPEDAVVEIKVLDKEKAEKLGLKEAIPKEIHPRDAFLAAVVRKPNATLIRAFSLPDPYTTYIGLDEMDKKIFLNKVRTSLGLDDVK